jgi:uncharacterized protein YndB with AHSA1/START domain
MPVAPVRKTIDVETSPARAFRVFTEEFSLWWPLTTHHIAEQNAQTVVVEPRVGGRWFERAADGSECDWGKVLVWDPPGRLVLSWQINGDWKPDATLETEVEIRFVSLGPAKTRVELEHRGLDRYGAAADQMRGIFDSEGGWNRMITAFANRANG